MTQATGEAKPASTKLPLPALAYGWLLIAQGIAFGFAIGDQYGKWVEAVLSMLLGAGPLTRKRWALWLTRVGTGMLAAGTLFMAFLVATDGQPFSDKVWTLLGYLAIFLLMSAICTYFTNSKSIIAAFRE